MAQVRNKTTITLWVPELNRSVEPGEVVDVPDERLDGYTCQPDTWANETSGKASKSSAASAPADASTSDTTAGA
jgi:hypothetical protein